MTSDAERPVRSPSARSSVDPVFDGEPTLSDGDDEQPDALFDELLELPVEPSPVDDLRDADDEDLDVPAEELAMHLVDEPRSDWTS
jgi:hypothetical protein